MGKFVYKLKTKRILSDGSEKCYTYLREEEYISQKKETYFDKLIKYEEVKNILKNETIRKPEKVNMIGNFIIDKDEFKNLTFSQISNFVYRYTKPCLTF